MKRILDQDELDFLREYAKSHLFMLFDDKVVDIHSYIHDAIVVFTNKQNAYVFYNMNGEYDHVLSVERTDDSLCIFMSRLHKHLSGNQDTINNNIAKCISYISKVYSTTIIDLSISSKQQPIIKHLVSQIPLSIRNVSTHVELYKPFQVLLKNQEHKETKTMTGIIVALDEEVIFEFTLEVGVPHTDASICIT